MDEKALFLKKIDGTYEKVMEIDEATWLDSDEKAMAKLDIVFNPKPLEASFTWQTDPISSFRFKTKMLGGLYWAGKVPRVRRAKRNGHY